MVSRVTLLLLSLLLTACSDESNNRDAAVAATAPEVTAPAPEVADPNPYAGYTSALYEGPENWLCRPDIEGDANICARDIASTIVFADGSTQLEESPVAADAAVDCFYVYPTISPDPEDNSDLVADAEIGVTFTQAARYRSVCKIHAPLYRQITLTALLAGEFGGEAAEIAYADVVDAFKRYVASAEGRGFILIGHSQGTGHLIRLIQEEIEADSFLASRMISAHLIGISVALPNDGELGATFASTPPCTFENETSCFVNYVSFRESVPPVPETALFGITDSDDTRAACTHPVDLGAGRLDLDSYFTPGQLPPFADATRNDSITTPFVKAPGLIQGECIEQDGKGYLAISVDADPADPRTDIFGNDFLPGWGLHLVDIPLAQGDLVKLAARQIDVWLDN